MIVMTGLISFTGFYTKVAQAQIQRVAFLNMLTFYIWVHIFLMVLLLFLLKLQFLFFFSFSGVLPRQLMPRLFGKVY